MQTLFGPQEKGLFSKLREAVASTRSHLVTKIEDVVKGKKEIDAELLDDGCTGTGSRAAAVDRARRHSKDGC